MAKNEIVFWAGAFLFSGICLASFSFSLWWVLLPFFVFLGWFKHPDVGINRQAVFLFLLAGLVGIFYYHTFAVAKESREILPKENQPFTATVIGEPKLLEKVQIISAKLGPPFRGEIDLLTTPLADFEYGEKIRVRGKTENNVWPARNNMVFPDIQKTGEVLSWSPRKIAIEFKKQLITNFKLLLNSNEAALLGGLTFGARGDFRESFKEAMKRSGTTHLVALSGYNISILIWAVERLLKSRLSRRTFFIVALCLVGLFVLAVGAEASITRAAIMGVLVLLATESGRLYSFRHAVLYAALGMSLFNPALPRFDLGFQLSFLSLLGIALLEPLIKDRIKLSQDRKSFLGWRENLSATLSAQLGVFPILIMSFGSFSLTSILANVLILWIVPFVMALGFIVAALGLIHFSLGLIIQPFLHIALSYMILIINLAAAIPSVQVPWVAWWTIAYYACLVWLVYTYSHHEKSKT
jgi:competence protein ComEC